MLFLLLIVSITIVHSLIVFDGPKMQDSLKFQEMEIFKGEFPCIPDFNNGSRQFVTFAMALKNTGDEDVKIMPYTSPLRINWTLEAPRGSVINAGYFNLSCVRDTFCDAEIELKFYTCFLGGISVNCTTFLNERTSCQWVDLTGMSLWRHYWLTLTIHPSVEGLGTGVLTTDNITLDFVPRELPVTKTESTLVSVLLMTAFALPNLVYFIMVIVMIARRGKDIVNYKTYKLKRS